MNNLAGPEDPKRKAFREGLVAFLKGSAPTGIQVGADLLLPGSGTLAAALFSGFVSLIDAVGTRRAQETVDATLREIKTRLEAAEASQADLNYLFSDEFLLELRRMLEVVAKSNSDEKTKRARQFLANKFMSPPDDASEHALDEFVASFVTESSDLELRMTMILEDAPSVEGEASSAVHAALIEQLARALGLTKDAYGLLTATIERLCSRGIAASLGTWGGTRSLRGLTPLGVRVKLRLLGTPDDVTART